MTAATNMTAVREAAKVNVSSTYGPEGKWSRGAKTPEVREESLRTNVLNVLMSCCKARTADKKPLPPAFTAGAADRTAARKVAAAVLASCARIVAMTAFCMAVMAVPAACTVVTGVAPTECGKGCFDV